ncbi:ribonuclease Z [Embleya hyalina]|uniref:Ribonuclease Z n=1 Tax=Embleya hyalina TaxID=516124 RepID=A0A401YPE4_9ACTN|nr:ribonuclease Z [Embleya hyalina]GCD96457.1 ribonuclease Z [Embleya hyalina]
MSTREFVVLGTASQAPTRQRNHNGYLLRWDGEGLLFDPGEGTQRQMLHAGVAAHDITRICVTHFHGDHCLGLPGVLQRLSLDRVPHPVTAYFPASGQHWFDRLHHATAFHEAAVPIEHPLAGEHVHIPAGPFTLEARRLSHPVESYGYRVVEPDGRRILPERLAAHGVAGPDVGRLQREGRIGGVTLEQVSVPRPGQKFAFVMDTRRCAAAVELARDVDLLVCESTFADADAELAYEVGHLTAREAAAIAAEAGARQLVLTHFSQRYPDVGPLLDQAREVFPDTVAAHDLDRITIPRRRPAPE